MLKLASAEDEELTVYQQCSKLFAGNVRCVSDFINKLLQKDVQKHISSISNITIYRHIGAGAGFYSLISSLKTYHRTLHFTPWSLDLLIHVPFQLPGEHTVLQPFWRIELIVSIVISVLPGTHLHLRVKCLAQGHTILTMSQY